MTHFLSDIRFEAAKPLRKFIPQNFQLNSWDDLQPLFQNLKERKILSASDLDQWISDKNEMDCFLEENMAWRYIKTTCDTASQEKRNAFQFFISEISPKLSEFENELNQKLLDSPFKTQVSDSAFFMVLRSIEKEISLFREANIPIETELSTLQQQYGATVGNMTVELNGQTLTLQKAAIELQSPNREEREKAYLAIQARRLQEKEKLSNLFIELVKRRKQLALNAGFSSYTHYAFKKLGRFDYDIQDALNFHQAVQEKVVPLLKKGVANRAKQMGLNKLKPFDLGCDALGRSPLKPFKNSKDLLNKGIEVLNKTGAGLGNALTQMDKLGHLDLESRVGKAPGGYNYPLDESGAPFIFMNAAGSLRDVVTLIHEAGHAIHSFASQPLPLSFYRHCPAEVAELASMGMELLTLKHWEVFFPNKEENLRAQQEHLEQVIDTLPWVATIDSFQHWVYSQDADSLTPEKLEQGWDLCLSRFETGLIDYQGLEAFRLNMWQKQLHLFEVPFYYIEYGMAQLGAIALWLNYQSNPEETVKKYLKALQLGYTKPIKEIYQTAGIKFDFSANYIGQLMDFVSNELNNLVTTN